MKTTEGHVWGWRGRDAVDLRLHRDSAGTWTLNDELCAEVQGCMDLDLSFTPATNLVPLRRLSLRSGSRPRYARPGSSGPRFGLRHWCSGTPAGVILSTTTSRTCRVASSFAARSGYGPKDGCWIMVGCGGSRSKKERTRYAGPLSLRSRLAITVPL